MPLTGIGRILPANQFLERRQDGSFVGLAVASRKRRRRFRTNETGGGRFPCVCKRCRAALPNAVQNTLDFPEPPAGVRLHGWPATNGGRPQGPPRQQPRPAGSLCGGGQPVEIIFTARAHRQNQKLRRVVGVSGENQFLQRGQLGFPRLQYQQHFRA